MIGDRHKAWLLAGVGTLLIAMTGVAGGAAQTPPSAGPGPTPARPAPAIPGQLIVRFRRATTGADRRDARADADVDLERPLKVPGAQLLEVEKGQTVAAAERELERHPGVLYAEPNRRITATQAPNDPRFGELWGLQNTGQVVEGVAGTPGADIDAVPAWQRSTGSPSALVAITDTGLDRDHPDLAANAWTNPGEAGEKRSNRIDDDRNGYVDDWRGWDFDASDNDPSDVHGHGTHVAGTVGASGGNGAGVVGVSPSVSLVGVKVLSDGGSGSTAGVADGFVYAGRLGADVVNASLGGDGLSQLLADAMASQPETLYVVAAGNDATDVEFYPTSPCAEPPANVVCVAASDNRDRLASFSNYGRTSVDLAAPGVNTLSTVPGSGYGFKSGTSMATPHVAGAAALLAAAYPDEGALRLKSRLMESVDPLEELKFRSVSGGRLNLAAALGVPANVNPAAALALDRSTARVQERVRLDASGSSDPDGRIAAYDWDLDGNGSFEHPSGGDPVLRHTWDEPLDVQVGVRVTDDRGGTAIAHRRVTITSAPPDAPVARLTWAPERVVATEPVTFDASASGGISPIVRYEWDLDGDWTYELDGGPDPRSTRTFPRAERRTIGLRITDAGGRVSELRRGLIINQPQPVATFTVEPQSPVVGQTVRFDGGLTTTPNDFIVFWIWDLDGDDSWDPDYGPVASRTFTKPGTYTASLTVMDDRYGVSVATRTFTVRPAVNLTGAEPPAAYERLGESDGDGAIEPGEGLLVNPRVGNTGSSALTGVQGSLRSLDPRDIRTGGGLTAFPDLDPGSSALPDAPLAADTYASLTCGESLELEVEVETDQGGGVVPLSIPSTGHTGTPQPVDTWYPFTLQPGWWLVGGFHSPVQGAIKDVDIRIGEIRHADIGNLAIRIGPPDEEGTPRFDDEITLIQGRGGGGDDMIDTVFDSDADTPIESGQPPFTGRFRPEQSLEGLVGRPASGNWRIEVDNYSGTSAAELKSIGADVTPAECGLRGETPEARVEPSRWRVGARQPVVLDASKSSIGRGQIVEYRWDLDDDGYYERTTTEPKVTTSFGGLGYRRANLQVVGDERGVASTGTWIEVRPSTPPDVVVAPVPDVDSGTPVTFDASGSFDTDGEIVAYEWDLNGDWQYETPGGPRVTQSFETPDYSMTEHWVGVRVTDDTGEQSTLSQSVKVRGRHWTPWTPDPPVIDPPAPDDREPLPPPPPPRWSPPPAGPPSFTPSPGSPHGSQAPTQVALTVGVKRTVTPAALRRGVPVALTCSRRCVARARLILPRSVARKLRVSRKGLEIAVARKALLAGRPATLRLRGRAAALRALSKVKAANLKLQVEASGPGGQPATTEELPVRLVR